MNAPKSGTFFLALILAGVGIVSHFVSIPVVTDNQFWFVSAGYVLLALGCLFKGL